MSSHGVPRVSGAQVDKSEAAREKERKQIEQYRKLEQDVVQRVKSKDYSNDTFQLVTVLLKQNPEYYTIWNYRRILLDSVFDRELSSGNTAVTENPPTAADAAHASAAGLTLAQQEIALLIREDLQFLIPLLRSFPKCYWIWNHRSWLLAIATSHLPPTHALGLWQGELALVGKMLALDSRNFHGWGYRRKVVAEIERLSGGQSMCAPEFEYTTKMIQADLSNFSAWHNRSKLIPQLLDERSAGPDERREFFDAEFELITRALYTDEKDQSLWFYHQYLMSTLDPTNAATAAVTDGKKDVSPILSPCSNADRLYYLEQEIDNLRDMLDGAEDAKYILQALLGYSSWYLEIEAGNRKITTMEMKEWLEELKKLDPLREGRWKDLEAKLGI
ncbi:protein prenylyltransferase [Polychaeton citri CBS 116435]|uniref:Geranylgeranyl transferase type-2 subunit alpha n=1 Tax=Polychaeton citri CBS 116435 TaxID=1314669 RepID=A0A9P4QBH9_9PEZI|nr:protein prenylyltransferase [Polychaeton citri CBS 116435]